MKIIYKLFVFNLEFNIYISLLLYLYFLYLPYSKANIEQKAIIKNNRKLSEGNDINIINKNHIIILGAKEYNYITNTIDDDGELFIESSSIDKSKKRYVAGLFSNGRNYFQESNIKVYSLSEEIKRRTGNSLVISSNNKKYLLSIYYDSDGYFELLDLTSIDSPNNLLKKADKTLDNSIKSNINSLFKLKNENFFFFAYLYHNIFFTYYLTLIKGSINVKSDSFDYNISLIRSNIKAVFSYTLSCFETTDNINCFFVDENKKLSIIVLDENFNTICNSLLGEETKVNSDELFHKGIFLKNEISVYMYFIRDILRPKLSIKYLRKDNDGYNLYNLLNNINIIILYGPEDLDNDCDKNDIFRINENRFIFISSLPSNEYFLILLFDLYNNDKSLAIRKFLFNLDGYKMNKNLRLFNYRNFVGFSYCYGNTENCAYRILNYGNTTDYEIEADILNNLEKINPLNLVNNINIENNLFGYQFIGIKIVSIPNKELTGLLLTKSKNKSEILENDILINDSIIFSFISNTEVTEGLYILEFAAVIGEIDYETFNSQTISTNFYGEQKNQESFFSPLNYTGRTGYYTFNITKKENLNCHRNCYSCNKNGESDYEQNCITCINGYYFIENSSNCFKDPIGYYLNEYKNYSSCHPLCAYCESKEINATYMNCISCIENDYVFYPKSKNCLKCTNFVNYEQTECINEIPDGYYLLNNSYGLIEKCNEYCSKCTNAPTINNMNCDKCIDGYYLRVDDNNTKNCFPNSIKPLSNYYIKDNEPNIYYKCYELCGSCDKEGNLYNMNCLTCINNNIYEYDFVKRNCFPKVSCMNYFYYAFNEQNLKSKICLPENAICPEDRPYVIIETKECVFGCSYENLINEKCKLSNKYLNSEQTMKNFEKEIENSYLLMNQILNGNFEDLTVYGNIFIFQITTTSNQQNKIQSNINDSVSTIDLGDCENLLKRDNNISDNISLIILKYDIKTKESNSAQVEYEIYNPLTKQKLNLDICKNTSINIFVPIDINEELLGLYEDAKSQGYDIFDPNNKFYNDICTPYTTINGTDIILSDRVSDILNSSGDLCEIDCEYQGFFTEVKKGLCQCSIKLNLTLNTTENKTKIFKNIHRVLKNRLNYKILRCYKLLFDIKSIIKNFGFYILTSIIILFLIFSIINFITYKYKLRLVCSKIVENRKNYMMKNMNKIDDSPKNLDLKNKKSRRTSKDLEEPPKKQIKKNQTNDIVFVTKEQMGKRFSTINASNNKNNKIKTNNNTTNNKIYKINKKMNYKSLSKRTSVPSMQNSNSLISRDTFTKMNVNKTKYLYNNIMNNSKKFDEKCKFVDIFIANISKEDIDNLFYDEELNQLDYKYATEMDKRDFISYYFSLIKQKQMIIFTFLVDNDYNIYFTKNLLFLCSLNLYLMINTMFFNDDNMHKIYIDNGEYNLMYQIPQILYSSIISSVITMIFKDLSLSQKAIIKIKEMIDIKRMVDEYLFLVKYYKYKLIVFNLLGFILLLFNWYYISVFCSVYPNSQSHLITDIFTSFGLSLIYPFLLSLIPGFFRIPALKDDKKQKKCMYRISQLVAYI